MLSDVYVVKEVKSQNPETGREWPHLYYAHSLQRVNNPLPFFTSDEAVRVTSGMMRIDIGNGAEYEKRGIGSALLLLAGAALPANSIHRAKAATI